MKALGPYQRTGFTLVGCIVVAASVALGINALDRPRPHLESHPVVFGEQSTPFISPGKVRPATVSASEANLPEDELVIGVTFHDKSRAYCRKAFAGIYHHVVNDVLNGAPITVTHCDRNRCSRVYTGPGVEPLPVDIGGYTDGLLLLVDGVFYHQIDGRPINPDSSRLPFELYAFEETTWGKWRKAHPDTDVYLGAPAHSPKAPAFKE